MATKATLRTQLAWHALQGTAAVTLAGLFAAMLAQGKPVGDITKQRYVMVGAGSAGTGIADLTAEAMAKHVRCAFRVAVMHIWGCACTRLGAACDDQRGQLVMR